MPSIHSFFSSAFVHIPRSFTIAFDVELTLLICNLLLALSTQNKVSTNPGSTQALGKDFPTSAPQVIQRKIPTA